MTSQRLTQYLAIAALMAGCGFVLFNPLRLAFIANVFVPFLFFNLAVMLCCGLWFLSQWRKVEIRPVEFVIVFLVLVTAALTPYEGRKIVDIMTDLLRPILFVVTVVVIRNFVNIDAINKSHGVQRWFRISMWVTLVVVPACWFISKYMQPLYPAFSSIDSMFGLGWLLAIGNFFGQGLYFAVLIASGKRGVYLAAFFVLCVCYWNKRLTLRGWMLFFSGLAVGGAMFSLFMSEVQQLFFKGVQLTGLSGGGSETERPLAAVASTLGGGRIEELRGALAALDSYFQLVFGAGLGFAYHAEGFEQAGGLHRNLHFTPASLVIYYGVPFAIAFFFYLATFFFAALRITKRSPGLVSYTYAVYCLASMVFLLTEFSVFAYVNFAISCGVVGATVRMKSDAASAPSVNQ